MQVHMMVFIQEHGPVIGVYPCDVRPDNPRGVKQFGLDMLSRWEAACANPSCIAAFWFIDSTLRRMEMKRDTI